MKRLALLLVLLVVPAAVLAHGEAAWVMENPDTAWCCSPGRDCNPIEARRVHSDGTYWWVDGLDGKLKEDDRGFYWGTPDGKPWACQTPGTTNLRCLFIPAPGA
jgi:hypothetical protein